MSRWFRNGLALFFLVTLSAAEAFGTAADAAHRPAQVVVAGTAFLPLVIGQPADPGSVPLCADHSSALYHPLYDEARGCHYDHEHKHDPDEVAAVFGPAGAWFGGTSISYPWQTPSENEHKHEAYGFMTRSQLASNGQALWIRSLRVQGHVTNEPFVMPDGSLAGGYLGDVHSFSAEAEVCRAAGECGIVRFGGWLDFGCLQVFDASGLVYECLPGETNGPLDSGNRQVYANGKSVWYGEGRLNGAGEETLFRVTVAFGQADSAIWVDESNVTVPQYFCSDRQCGANSSTLQQHVLRFSVPGWMDPDGDGYADYAGYTDQWGVLQDSCAAPGPTCVPLIVENAPVGSYEHRDDEHGYPIDALPEFDSSPPGVWWITGNN